MEQLSQMVNALLTRLVLSSVVGALVSGGLIFFAFEQSVRGVELAVETSTASVQQNGEWLRSLSSKIDESIRENREFFDRINKIDDRLWRTVHQNSNDIGESVAAVLSSYELMEGAFEDIEVIIHTADAENAELYSEEERRLLLEASARFVERSNRIKFLITNSEELRDRLRLRMIRFDQNE